MSERAQPETFEFTSENSDKIANFIRRYPDGKQASAILAVLDLAQRQGGGWLSRAAMDCVAETLGMAPIRVYEVASFYEMYNLDPVGEHMVRVCTTTPCQLRGASDILDACKEEIGAGVGETSADGKFTLKEFECLGACVNAPIVWIDDDYYEDLDADTVRSILKRFREGESAAPGSQQGRQTSAPAPGPTTLTDTAGAGGE